MIEPLVQVLHSQKLISNIKYFRNHHMNLYYDLYCPLQKKWRGWIFIENGKRKRFTDNSSNIEALIKFSSKEKRIIWDFSSWLSLPPSPTHLEPNMRHWKSFKWFNNQSGLESLRKSDFCFCWKVRPSTNSFSTHLLSFGYMDAFQKWLIFSETPKCGMQHVIGRPIYLGFLNPEK